MWIMNTELNYYAILCNILKVRLHLLSMRRVEWKKIKNDNVVLLKHKEYLSIIKKNKIGILV